MQTCVDTLVKGNLNQNMEILYGNVLQNDANANALQIVQIYIKEPNNF